MSRRFLVGAGVAAVAAAPFVGRAQAQPTRAVDNPDAALARLAEGNARYVSGKMNERDFSAGRASRAQGQKPFAAILGCADSRVAPELAFDQPPGELFVVRVAGNFVTPDGLGSLEFGVAVLGAQAIMVLGHTSCGAVNGTVDALQKGNNLPGHIADIATAMKPGIEPVMKQPGADIYQRAVIANVRYNVQRLLEAKPILADMVAAKKLKVVGGVYDLPTGKITMV
jgi:carbonic anhydrase